LTFSYFEGMLTSIGRLGSVCYFRNFRLVFSEKCRVISLVNVVTWWMCPINRRMLAFVAYAVVAE